MELTLHFKVECERLDGKLRNDWNSDSEMGAQETRTDGSRGAAYFASKVAPPLRQSENTQSEKSKTIGLLFVSSL